MNFYFFKTFFFFLLIFAITGCAAKWANIDNTPADDLKIKHAKSKCHYDEELYNLSIKMNINDYLKFHLDNPKADEAIDNYEKQETLKVHTKLNTCMKEEGLKELD
ncbi:hypothetical protein [Sulfurimonas sp. HSL3-2]|uniref:hypothetical protein n=1 Tax=Hydrocurvibacter mobilis TaxID=3131936 RepID=UPI0031FA079E